MRTFKHRRILILALLVGAAAAILVLIALAGGVQASRIAFPSGLANSDLIRTRVEFMDALHFETWQNASGLSYSFWVPFESQDSSGGTLQCRVEMEGWLRTVSRHRNLLDLYCVCERTQLHHDRETSCPGLP